MSSAADRNNGLPTWGLLSRDRSLPGVEFDVLGDDDRVLWPSLPVRSDDGVAGCFIVDLSKLLMLIPQAKDTQ